jgi:hypothetical protein
VPQDDRGPDVLELDEALARLAEWDERKAKIIEMALFRGMRREDIATACGLILPTEWLRAQSGFTLTT